MPVVVVVTHGDSLAVAPPPGEALDPRLSCDVAKRAVPLVAKEAVARLDRWRVAGWGTAP